MGSVEKIGTEIQHAVSCLPLDTSQEAQQSITQAADALGETALGASPINMVRSTLAEASARLADASSHLTTARSSLNSYLESIGAAENPPEARNCRLAKVDCGTTSSSLASKNQAALSRSELGPVLLDAYNMAVAADPRLAEVEIIAIPDDNQRIAFARPAWKSASGRHQINIRLGNTDSALKLHKDAVDRIPGARQFFANAMGIDEANLTPVLLYLHSTLHELGHTLEYMDYEEQPEQLLVRRLAEKHAMPAGNVGALKLLNDPQRLSALAHELGVSPDQLVSMQFRAYRNLTSEKRADDFAGRVIKANPAFRDSLASV